MMTKKIQSKYINHIYIKNKKTEDWREQQKYFERNLKKKTEQFFLRNSSRSNKSSLFCVKIKKEKKSIEIVASYKIQRNRKDYRDMSGAILLYKKETLSWRIIILIFVVNFYIHHNQITDLINFIRIIKCPKLYTRGEYFW